MNVLEFYMGDVMKYFYENHLNTFEGSLPVNLYQNKNFSFLAHWHPEFELVYVSDGSIRIGINKESKTLMQGEMAVCCSGDIHYYESLSDTSMVTILIFKPEFAGFPANFPERQRFICPFVTHDTAYFNELSSIKDILYRITDEKQFKKEHYKIFIKAHLVELCGMLIRYLPTYNYTNESRNPDNLQLSVVQNVLTYIEANYINDLTLESIADEFKLDRFNLSKMVNLVTGMNLKSYINTLRILKAENMIQGSSKPLTYIALECGFNSIRTFNRAYKALRGCTPSCLRQE